MLIVNHLAYATTGGSTAIQVGFYRVKGDSRQLSGLLSVGAGMAGLEIMENGPVALEIHPNPVFGPAKTVTGRTRPPMKNPLLPKRKCTGSIRQPIN